MSANLFRRTQFANFAVDMHTITRNALAMTARMAATTVVGLLTWRIALQLLGAYSLGLYSVIAGVIALGEVLYATLGGAYDRYMAYTLGLAIPISAIWQPPPVIKAYAAGDNDRMWRMALRALAWSAGIFGVCAAVLYAFADTLMPLWLGPEMPSMTVALLGIALAVGMCVAVTNVFAAVVHATGRIRAYSLVSGTIYLCAPAALYFAAQHYGTDMAYAAIIPIYAAVTVCAVLFARSTAGHRVETSEAVNNTASTRPRRILVIIRSLDMGGAERALIDSLQQHPARPSQSIDIRPYAADVGPTASPKTSRCCPRYGPRVSTAERWPCNYGQHVTVVRCLCVDVWHAQMSLQRLTTS